MLNVLSGLSSQTQKEPEGLAVLSHDAQLLYQNITEVNMLSTANYSAVELISGIASVVNQVELLHALNASFTEDIDISPSIIAINELRNLFERMRIDSTGSPDHDEY